MKNTKIGLEIHLVDDVANGMMLLLAPPYVLLKSEKIVFIKIIHILENPTIYIGQLLKKTTIDEELARA